MSLPTLKSWFQDTEMHPAGIWYYLWTLSKVGTNHSNIFRCYRVWLWFTVIDLLIIWFPMIQGHQQSAVTHSLPQAAHSSETFEWHMRWNIWATHTAAIRWLKPLKISITLFHMGLLSFSGMDHCPALLRDRHEASFLRQAEPWNGHGSGCNLKNLENMQKNHLEEMRI